MGKFTKRVRRRRLTKRGGGENANLRKKAHELAEKAKVLRQEAIKAAEEAKRAAEESEELYKTVRQYIRPAPSA